VHQQLAVVLAQLAGPGYRHPWLARHLSVPGRHSPVRLPLITQEGLLCFRMQPFKFWRWRESPSVAHFVCAPCAYEPCRAHRVRFSSHSRRGLFVSTPAC